MSDRNCSNCLFFKPSTTPVCLGKCDYPVPEWLRVQGSSYISLPEYEGKNCPTHKSQADLALAVLKERG